MRDFSKIEVMLLSQRETLESRVNALERDGRRAGEALDADFAEQAVQRQNDEVIDALGDAGISELQQINAALHRLAEHRFGICASCGTDIPMERLEVLPYTDLCIDCAELND